MMEIINRITSFTHRGMPEFRVVFFAEDTILDAPVEQWPPCEALIAFYSNGFPLQKAQEYVKLRDPYVFNDLNKQSLLFDRRRVYAILESIGVPVPKYACFDASKASGMAVDEGDEYMQIDGKRLQKPLVEKPISGEDHNIYIYYPRSQGGGSQRLFRKVGSQ